MPALLLYSVAPKTLSQNNSINQTNLQLHNIKHCQIGHALLCLQSNWFIYWSNKSRPFLIWNIVTLTGKSHPKYHSKMDTQKSYTTILDDSRSPWHAPWRLYHQQILIDTSVSSSAWNHYTNESKWNFHEILCNLSAVFLVCDMWSKWHGVAL